MKAVDDLGMRYEGDHPRRVISLVPSLTHTIASVDPSLLVGATQWCSEPSTLNIERIGGTKNPHCERIIAMAPDVVIANKEENRAEDIAVLRNAGIPVWVTDIDSVEGALGSLRTLITDLLGADLPSWWQGAYDSWHEEPRLPDIRVVVPIWKKPWMWVGSSTFAHDVLERCGLINCLQQIGSRYPRVDLAQAMECEPDLVILPDEPYRFTMDDIRQDFPAIAHAFIPGRFLSWYGPDMEISRLVIEDAIMRVLPAGRWE